MKNQEKMKNRITFTVLFLFVLLSNNLYSQWSGDPAVNTPICILPLSEQGNPAITTDGNDGAIITWYDTRDGGFGNTNIYAQSINSSGYIQWGLNGVAVCAEATSPQVDPAITSDGAGGAFITWIDLRDNATTNYDVYAQRIDASGAIVWNTFPDGRPICTQASSSYQPAIISDGQGGAIITWWDLRNGNSDIYAQRIDASGTPQWITYDYNNLPTTDGVPVCTIVGSDQRYPKITSDGQGGAIITWYDERNGSGNSNPDVYAQRIDASGNLLWATDGVVVCSQSGHQMDPQITSDGNDGAFITWWDDRNGNWDIYAQNINSSGAVVAPWVTDGLAVCTLASNQQYPSITSDGSGGAIITWYDERNGSGGGWSDIYAQGINSSGVAQWATDGVPISTRWTTQYLPFITSAGNGEAIITWRDYSDNNDVYATKLFNTGPACTDFEDGTTNGWQVTNALSSIIPDGSNHYIETTTDQSVASAFFNESPPLTGNWNANLVDGCGTLCWDVNYLFAGDGNDGSAEPLTITPSISIVWNGVSASFVTNNLITAGDGWHSYCAPLSLQNPDGTLPSNSDGHWVMSEWNNDGMLWDYLLSNVSRVEFSVDPTSYQNERFGFDNICKTFKDCDPVIELGSICGIKFNDIDGDGQKQSNEPVLSNWTINLAYNNAAGAPQTLTTTTGTDGSYCFNNLMANTYTVSEGQLGGWNQTAPANPGTYSVTLTAGQHVVGQDFGNHLCIPTITGTTPGSTCGTGTVSLGATASSGTINWYDAGGILVGTGTSFTTNISTTTTYYVDATDVCGTTAVRTAVVATVNALPTVSAITGTFTLCVGSTTLLADATTGGAWTSVPLGVATVSATGLVTGVSAGTAIITYTIGGVAVLCSNSVTQTVTVNANPTITSTTPASRCGTGIVTLGATASAGTVNWYDALTGGNLVGTGNSYTTPSNNSTTTYYVEATANGCTTTVRTAVVATINSLPVVSAPVSVNQGSTITLSPTTGGTWISNYPSIASVNASTGLVTGLSPGTATFLFTNTITGCSATTSSVAVVSDCIYLCNPDFEEFLGVTPPSSGFSWIPQANISCWKTTATDGMIEIWHTGYGLVPAHSGNYFAEINATQNATLYQSFSATVPQTVIVSFWHRGRFPGVDVMKVSILAPDLTPTPLGTFSDNNTAWNFYSVSYPIAAPGTHTLRFESVSSDNGNGPADGGNFLDDINVTCPGSICGIKYNDLDGDGQKQANEPVIPNWTINLSGSATATATTGADGSYCFNNLAPGSYTITEGQLGGWAQTAPANPGTYTITLTAGQHVIGQDFGNQLCAPIITGTTPGSVCGTGTVTVTVPVPQVDPGVVPVIVGIQR